jgi:transcriptional regulator GlxA family with amidase domain
MHAIGLFLCPDHLALDLAGPLSAFEKTNSLSGRRLYDLHVISERGGPVVGSSGLPVHTRCFEEVELDTVVFIGGDVAPMHAPGAVAAAKDLAGRASRVASVCSAAFLLAEARLLDGRRATTHWRIAPEFQQRYPAVKVEADRIFIADGRVWTSAGVAAGIDLALALIETDHGSELARDVARELVVPHRRPGGQSQFSAMSQMEPDSDRIRLALAFARDHLTEPLPIERLAEAARLSIRQFGRAFRRETGETPAKAVERLRVEAARARLQSGAEPIEQIARAVGFTDPERMRRAFVKIHGHPPQSIRRTSRANAT